MLLALTTPSTLVLRALPLMPTTYGAAAGSLATRALLTPGAEAAVLGSTALALLFDFGPSALRDLSTSDAASSAARDELIDVSPSMILIDNFVHNLGAEDEITTQKKEAAQDRSIRLMRRRGVVNRLLPRPPDARARRRPRSAPASSPSPPIVP